jgi:tetratricopeptide (TPR) repeat protein
LPEDREIDFDLGNCYQNLGYLLLKRGHAEEALAALVQAERTNRSLVQKLPKVPRCRRNLALVLRWRGEALEALERSGVLDTYREGVTILEKLAAEFPANVRYQLDLARCLNKLGAQMAQGNRGDEAERLYQKALAALSSKDVHDWPLECRREKAMTLGNQGDFRQGAGRADAEEPLRSSVQLARELAAGKTPARQDRQYLAIARNNLGEALRDRGRNAEACQQFEESVAGLEALVTENSAAVEDRYYLGYIYEQQAKLLVKMDKLAEAKLAFEKAVARQKEAVKLTDGKSRVHRTALAGHLAGLADLCLTVGEYDAAMQAAVDLAKAAPDSGQGCLDAAKILARSASRIQADAKLARARKDELGRKFLGRTVVMLREAIDANTKLAESIRNDPVFKELRDRPEFQTMLSSLVDLGRNGAR